MRRASKTSRARNARASLVLATNTSKVPGVRMRWRYPRWGRPVLQIDVSWTEDGARSFTTFPAIVEGMQRAFERREAATGEPMALSPRTALYRMRRLAGQPKNRGI